MQFIVVQHSIVMMHIDAYDYCYDFILIDIIIIVMVLTIMHIVEIMHVLVMIIIKKIIFLLL